MVWKKFQDLVVSLVVFVLDAVTGIMKDTLKWFFMQVSGIREILLLL